MFLEVRTFSEKSEKPFGGSGLQTLREKQHSAIRINLQAKNYSSLSLALVSTFLWSNLHS